MKRSGILNQSLNAALASLGHGDMLLVCDAGFPIPHTALRIDLALAADIPDLRTVLSLIAGELIVESVVLAEETEQFNPALFRFVQQTFGDAELLRRPHSEMLSEAAHQAKAIVRTGAFDPWGNIGLLSGVDVPRWFDKPQVIVPDYYRNRLESSS